MDIFHQDEQRNPQFTIKIADPCVSDCNKNGNALLASYFIPFTASSSAGGSRFPYQVSPRVLNMNFLMLPAPTLPFTANYLLVLVFNLFHPELTVV